MIIPAVMQPDWLKRFVKVTFIYLFIPSGSISEWTANMHTSLTISIYFPLTRHQPREWSQVQFMGRFGSTLSDLHRTDAAGERDIPRQF